jgi:hypothetical protein
MNGIENPVFTNENETNQKENTNSQIHSNKKMSPLMLLSLTFHSLGIIFGDM